MIPSLLALLALLPQGTRADELQELYRGARASAMGNAFVALADDEQAIFMNPAGLAGVENDTLHLAVLDLSLSSETVTGAMEVISAFSNFSSDSFDSLMGQDIYFRGQVAPAIVARNFGVALLMDQQVGLSIENPAIPNVDLLYQTTNGIQAAYGFSVLGRRHRGEDLRFGIGAKMLWRRGGVRDVPVTDLLTAGSGLIGELTGRFSRAYGFDVGAQYVREINPRVKLMAGAAWTEIGDLEFSKGGDTQEQNLSAGLATAIDMKLSTLTLAVDQRHLLQDTDWRKRTHLGAELKLPLLSAYAGINQVQLTYGAAFDLWIFRLTAASYAEETGGFAGQDTVRRYMMKLAFKMPL